MGTLLSVFDNEETDVVDRIYVKQDFNWDCGIACSTMAQRWATMDSATSSSSPLYASKATPLWTIDIYCFFKETNKKIDVSFSTEVPGLNNNHTTLDWYTQNIESDRKRVEDKFDLARRNKWSIDTAISTNDLIAMFHEEEEEDDGLSSLAAIALVNNNHLSMDHRNGGRETSATEVPYSGHYIFLLGFDRDNMDAIYLDPARDSRKRRCHRDLFAASRAAPGTDMDLLLFRRG